MECTGALAKDHADLSTLFARFNRFLEDGDLRRAFELLDYFWARLAVHIRAEHHQLFPALLELPASAFHGKREIPSAKKRDEVLEVLREDHDFFMDELTWAVKALKRLSFSPGMPEEAEIIDEIRTRVAAVTARLAPHNQLEEEAVYLWPGRMLDEAERTKLAQAIASELQDLPPRFQGPTPD